MKNGFTSKEWLVHAWVILHNHYHALVKSKHGQDLPDIIKTIHSKGTRLLKSQSGNVPKRVWWNYWDVCPKSENEYWAYFNYIHVNPVKHGYTRSPFDWKYSSIHDLIKSKDRDYIEYLLEQFPTDKIYPFDDF